MIGSFLLTCTSAVNGGQTLSRSLIHLGYSRNYFVYVPSAYTPGQITPLVVNLHGAGSSVATEMRWTGMNVVAERESFLVVYPEAINGAWWGPNMTNGYRDDTFLDAVIARVSAEFAVDAGRVYATGFSLGGGIACGMSVLRPYTFAAIASVGAARPYVTGTTILFPPEVPVHPCRPHPVLHIHGTVDSREPYDGGCSSTGQCYPPIEQYVGDWAQENGCGTTPTITNLADVDLHDGCAFVGTCTASSTVRLLTYPACGTYVDQSGDARPAEVLLYRVVGGGHSWPADFVTTYPSHCLPVNHDIDASTVIWEFFDRHRLAVAWADLDSDFDVDAADLELFVDCAAGPMVAYPTTCGLPSDGQGMVRADCDRDRDVDQDDFGAFQRCYSGAGRRPGMNCGK